MVCPCTTTEVFKNQDLFSMLLFILLTVFSFREGTEQRVFEKSNEQNEKKRQKTKEDNDIPIEVQSIVKVVLLGNLLYQYKVLMKSF